MIGRTTFGSACEVSSRKSAVSLLEAAAASTPFAVADQVRPNPPSRSPRPQTVMARMSSVDLPPLDGPEEMKSAAFVAGQLKERTA